MEIVVGYNFFDLRIKGLGGYFAYPEHFLDCCKNLILRDLFGRAGLFALVAVSGAGPYNSGGCCFSSVILPAIRAFDFAGKGIGVLVPPGFP